MKKTMRLVYMSTDETGKPVTKRHTYSDLIASAENVNIKKAAKAIDDLSAKPATFVEVVTIEQLD